MANTNVESFISTYVNSNKAYINKSTNQQFQAITEQIELLRAAADYYDNYEASLGSTFKNKKANPNVKIDVVFVVSGA